MKYCQYLIIISFLLVHSCILSTENGSQPDTADIQPDLDSVKTKSVSIVDAIKPQKRAPINDSLIFDYSSISGNAVFYIQENLDSLRFPTEADYDKYYHNGAFRSSRDGKLPFYCTGYFNSDSILDYATILIKDTTYQYVIAINSVDSNFEHFLLHSTPLVQGDSQPGMFISLLIETESKKELEHMFGTYYLDNESIDIDNMQESKEWAVTWINENRSYVELIFD